VPAVRVRERTDLRIRARQAGGRHAEPVRGKEPRRRGPGALALRAARKARRSEHRAMELLTTNSQRVAVVPARGPAVYWIVTLAAIPCAVNDVLP
jgi:hypothetical protein